MFGFVCMVLVSCLFSVVLYLLCLLCLCFVCGCCAGVLIACSDFVFLVFVGDDLISVLFRG